MKQRGKIIGPLYLYDRAWSISGSLRGHHWVTGRSGTGYTSSPGPKGEDCADLSTSMKSGIDIDQKILNSFYLGAEAGKIGPSYSPIQYGR